jgi:DNA-binding transcriptional LysR family regulator
MLHVRDLQIVRAIHAEGSLARAARVLGVGQPALTRSLAALEAKLRGPLFERNRRGMVPTDLCRAMLADGTDILERLERLDRRMLEACGTHTQELSVSAGPYAAETIGMHAAARMLSLHPSVRIRMVASNWAEVPRAVREREASIGLLDVSEISDATDLTMELLEPQPSFFVARRGHPLAGVATIDLDDIMAFPLVFLGRVPRRVQDPLVQAREVARGRGRLHPAFPGVIHESPTVSLTVVRHSDAVTGVTLPIAEAAIRAGHIVPLAWRAPWMTLRSGIIRARLNPVTTVEEAYVAALRAVAGDAAIAARAFLLEAGIEVATG